MLGRRGVQLILFACGASALSWACGSYVQRGSTLYHEGHYVEAAEVFERTEQRLGGAAHRDCAEYGLYRGLTLLELGDLRGSHQWLSYAYNVERAAPGTLQPSDRNLLDQGWTILNERLVDTTQSPPPRADSAMAAQPDAAVPPPEAGRVPRPEVRSFAQ